MKTSTLMLLLSISLISAHADTAPSSATEEENPTELTIHLLSPEGKRVKKRGTLTSPEGIATLTFQTKVNHEDNNDIPALPVIPGQTYRIRFENYQTAPFTIKEGSNTMDVTPQMLSPIPVLKKRELPKIIQQTYEQQVKNSQTEREEELQNRQIQLNDKTLRWKERIFGEEPQNGRSLWISMHGGGNATAELNDQQWNNQIALYEPDEGIYIAPRAPTDAWNLWHEAHIDPMFQQLIEDYVALRGVNPNRIYLMGYSAGGDGVWQLAPRMADRFAAAAMMAGHPNEASVLGLRNLPFALFVGAEDTAYDRNQMVEEKANELDRLHKEDPNGYTHLARIYKGLGHWMERKDQEALEWMHKFTRNPWPKKIVWLQDDILHSRFYWLKVPLENVQKDQQITATVKGQTITLEGDIPEGLRIRLSDELLDLDRPVTVIVNDKERFSAKVFREACIIQQTLQERLDPAAAATAEILLP